MFPTVLRQLILPELNAEKANEKDEPKSESLAVVRIIGGRKVFGECIAESVPTIMAQITLSRLLQICA
jgi:hypothetical protein